MNYDALMTRAREIEPWIIDLRRAIHRRPELGNQEVETSALVERTLRQLGWEVSRPMGTSVVALLRGGRPGRCVAFRADMDALPLDEENDLPFKSECPGRMHACGHDLHTSGLLGAARLLAERRDELAGSVKLFFQPDEEYNGGAARMIAAGCLENPHVDAVFGAHVDTTLPAGTVGLKYGKSYAASDMFTVVIRGEGCHGASPHRGIDAIAVGAQVLSALQQIVSRRTSPADSVVVTVGSFHAGTGGNIIADKAEFSGILRTLGKESRRKTRALFTQTVTGVCEALGAKAEIELKESYPGIVNWDEQVDFVRATAAGLVGAENVRMIDHATMGSEDFGYFIENTPGAFYKIGIRNPEIGATAPLHSPRFIADEAALSVLSALHAAVAMDFLSTPAES